MCVTSIINLLYRRHLNAWSRMYKLFSVSQLWTCLYYRLPRSATLVFVWKPSHHSICRFHWSYALPSSWPCPDLTTAMLHCAEIFASPCKPTVASVQWSQMHHQQLQESSVVSDQWSLLYSHWMLVQYYQIRYSPSPLGTFISAGG